MTEAAPNTNSSSFFICTSKTQWPDDRHMVFMRWMKGCCSESQGEICVRNGNTSKISIATPDSLNPVVNLHTSSYSFCNAGDCILLFAYSALSSLLSLKFSRLHIFLISLQVYLDCKVKFMIVNEKLIRKKENMATPKYFTFFFFDLLDLSRFWVPGCWKPSG